MDEIVSIVSATDRAAQKLWERASAASQRVAALMQNIPWRTVSGERSRAELAQATELLKQAAALLARTSAREELRYLRLERSARIAVSGEGSAKERPRS